MGGILETGLAETVWAGRAPKLQDLSPQCCVTHLTKLLNTPDSSLPISCSPSPPWFLLPNFICTSHSLLMWTLSIIKTLNPKSHCFLENSLYLSSNVWVRSRLVQLIFSSQVFQDMGSLSTFACSAHPISWGQEHQGSETWWTKGYVTVG